MTDNLPAVAGDAVATEIEAIQTRMRDDREGYFKDDYAQRRYTELIKARQTGASAPAKRSSTAERHAYLQSIVGSREYWQSPALQEEYRAALSGNILAAGNEPLAAADVIQQFRRFPATGLLLQEWGSDAAKNIEVYRDRVVDLLADCESEHAAELRSLFAAPTPAVEASLARWVTRLSRIQAPADDPGFATARKAFLSTPDGRAQRQIWGAAFDRNLSIYRARMRALVDSLDVATAGWLLQCFDRLSPEGAMAVQRWLARV